jgi:hypothetical protein
MGNVDFFNLLYFISSDLLYLYNNNENMVSRVGLDSFTLQIK